MPSVDHECARAGAVHLVLELLLYWGAGPPWGVGEVRGQELILGKAQVFLQLAVRLVRWTKQNWNKVEEGVLANSAFLCS